MFFETRIIDEGPQLFYEFIFNKRKIILIGEKHFTHDQSKALSALQQKKYTDVIKQYIRLCEEECLNVYILLEQMTGTKEKSIGRCGFVDCVYKSREESNCNVKQIDNRKLPESILEFTSFLSQLNLVIENHKDLSELDVLIKEKLFSDIESLIDSASAVLTAQKLINLIRGQLTCMKFLLEKHINNQNIYNFIFERKSSLENQLKQFFQVIENITEGDQVEEEWMRTDLRTVAIKMIQTSNDGEILKALHQVLSAYFQYYFDAIIMSELNKAQQEAKEGDIIILVAGVEHVKVLSHKLEEFKKPMTAVAPKDKTKFILPDELLVHLGLNEHQLQWQDCCIII